MEEKIQQDIFALADEKYKEFHSSLCPGVSTIVGVRIPVLRKYAKQLLKQMTNQELEQYLAYQGTYYEETMLQGMLIGLSKIEWNKKKEWIQAFVPKIDNWAVCDIVCAGIKEAKKEILQEDIWNFLLPYVQSDKEFEFRFGIVMWLDHFVNKTYIEEILDRVDDVKCGAYYAHMAVAWLLSICYIHFPEQTKQYLKDCKLDDATYQKAIQKTIESYRVSAEEKEKLRVWKKDRVSIE